MERGTRRVRYIFVEKESLRFSLVPRAYVVDHESEAEQPTICFKVEGYVWKLIIDVLSHGYEKARWAPIVHSGATQTYWKASELEANGFTSNISEIIDSYVGRCELLTDVQKAQREREHTLKELHWIRFEVRKMNIQLSTIPETEKKRRIRELATRFLEGGCRLPEWDKDIENFIDVLDK